MSGLVVLILRVCLALALYAFLALVLCMLSQDIKRTGLTVAGRLVPSIRLTIHTRKRRAVYQDLSQPEVTVGRDPRCDVPIADRSVAPRHARLSFNHGHWWLEDLTSSNGTRLNHAKLSRPTVLSVGDEIKCGHARVVVSLPSGAVHTGNPGSNRRKWMNRFLSR